MTEKLNNLFNEEIERYRNALLFYAKKCEWDTFEKRAGKLFDYIESIELSEIEKKFFRIFWLIFFALSVAVFFAFRIDIGQQPHFAEIKKTITFIALGGFCYELYFFMNFKIYMQTKIAFYKKRREKFIKNIEQDFKDIIVHHSL